MHHINEIMHCFDWPMHTSVIHMMQMTYRTGIADNAITAGFSWLLL